MAERHVREGQAHIVRQMELIEELRLDGHPIAEAEALLKVFQQTLHSHEQHLALIRAQLAGKA